MEIALFQKYEVIYQEIGHCLKDFVLKRLHIGIIR